MKCIAPNNCASHYRKKFTFSTTAYNNVLESLAPVNDAIAEFSESEVKERLEYAKKGLYTLIETYLDNDPALKRVANHIIKEGGDPLRAVANNDDVYLNANPLKASMLEVIVQTDGSRPSFLIKNDAVDLASSPLGDWNGKLISNAATLKTAIQCVGRINLKQRHIGTGFLIGKNVILTNRHVLQSIAQENDEGWAIHPHAYIDFGFEFKTRASVNPRKLKRLIYCGPQFIDGQHIDHSKLDVAIIELETAPDKQIPSSILEWNVSNKWAIPGTQVFIIGYPGDPGLPGIATYTASLLDKLFHATYGCKRLAPGIVIRPSHNNQSLLVTHDATTLGGNSGSLIVMISNEFSAAGLHYGGESEIPRENWGHVLGTVWTKIVQADETVHKYLEKEVKCIQIDD